MRARALALAHPTIAPRLTLITPGFPMACLSSSARYAPSPLMSSTPRGVQYDGGVPQSGNGPCDV